MKHLNEVEIADEYREMFQRYIRQAIMSTFSATRLNENMGQEYLGQFTDQDIVTNAQKYMTEVMDYLPNDEWKNFFIYYGCQFSDYARKNGKKVWEFVQ